MKRCRTLLFEVKGAEWDVDGRSPFTNANTPAEWDATAPECPAESPRPPRPTGTRDA